MATPTRIFNSIDVDTDALADALRELADDIDDGGALVNQAMTYVDAEADDAVRFGLGLDFHLGIGSEAMGDLSEAFEPTDE